MSLDAESDFTIVGGTSCCDKALSMAADLQPDILVIDLDMPRGDGLALSEMVRLVSPKTAVIILSINDDLFTCARAKIAGAAALVGKALPTQTLFSTIRAMAS